jgi:pSer/pThr/pTyr-binding forkhead associated (FHA) protein
VAANTRFAPLSYFEAGGADTERFTFPVGSSTRRVTLTGTSIGIGRRSGSQGTTPEIDPVDPRVSYERAQFLAQPDGTWAVVNEGSTNGTYINGERKRILPTSRFHSQTVTA